MGKGPLKDPPQGWKVKTAIRIRKHALSATEFDRMLYQDLKASKFNPSLGIEH